MNTLSEKKTFLMGMLLFFAINVFAQEYVVRQEGNKSNRPEGLKLELIKNKIANEVGVRMGKDCMHCTLGQR